MSLKTIEKIIGSNRYIATTFPARRAMNIQLRILNILGKGAASGGDISFSTDNAAAFALKMIGAVVGGMEVQGTEKLIEDMIEGVKIAKNGEVNDLKTIFDDHFALNLTELIEVLRWIIEENFPDFFGDRSPFRNIIGKATETIQTPN